MQTAKFILFMLLCLPCLAIFNCESPEGYFNPFINLFGMLYAYVVFGIIKIQQKLI